MFTNPWHTLLHETKEQIQKRLLLSTNPSRSIISKNLDGFTSQVHQAMYQPIDYNEDIAEKLWSCIVK